MFPRWIIEYQAAFPLSISWIQGCDGSLEMETQRVCGTVGVRRGLERRYAGLNCPIFSVPGTVEPALRRHRREAAASPYRVMGLKSR